MLAVSLTAALLAQDLLQREAGGQGEVEKPAAQPAPAEVVAEDPAWIPVELFQDRFVFFEGKVNGQTVEMMLDSGAEITVLSMDTARELGLRGGKRWRALGITGQQLGQLCSGVRFEFGGVQLLGQEVGALDLAGVSALLGRPVSVILGREVFRRYVVDVDYPARRVAFRAALDFEYTGTGFRLPVFGSVDGGWTVEAQVEGKGPGRFLVDTGNGGSFLMYGGFAAEHGLLDAGRSTSTSLAGGVGAPKPVQTLNLRSLTLGDVRLEAVPAAVLEGGFESEDQDGNLGADVLERFRAIFDVGRGELILEASPEAIARPFERDRTGLRAEHRSDALVVVEVVPGSPADDAGWRVGERIVAIDGRLVGPDYWVELFRWRYGAPGSRVVLRDGVGEERELVLEDYF